jgi:hypothetical protein
MNLHTAAYPGGEIRVSIFNIIVRYLQKKSEAFNGLASFGIVPRELVFY